METAGDRRKRKLTALVDQHGLAAVAEKAKVSAANLDQILKGVPLPAKADGTRATRGVGNGLARKIEGAFKLGTGWFDAPDELPRVGEEAMKLAIEYEKMNSAERQRLRLLMLVAREGIHPADIQPAPGMQDASAPEDRMLGGDSGLGELDALRRKSRK